MTAVPLDGRIAREDPLFARVSGAMFFAGFAIFGALYGVQPLMPAFAKSFDVSPAAASLTLSATTGALALSNFASGSLARRVGRKRLMVASLLATFLATALGAATADFTQFVASRALVGIVLAGVPAVAMAYLIEEIEPAAVGTAMGLYISGSVIGGLTGRLAAALLADAFDWRVAVVAVSAMAALGALWLQFSLPNGRGALHAAPPPRPLLATLKAHLADPGLRWLFAEGFVLMGAFVSTYNYVGFRLSRAPFGYSQTAIGFLFTLYLLGAVSSTLMGSLAGRFGRRKVLWIASALMPVGVLVTLPDSAPCIVAGVALITLGFFGGHSIASSWVGLRAESGRTEASALYLFFYYAGSSVVGTFVGTIYGAYAWPGVAAFLFAMTSAGFLIALRLSKIPPPAHLRPRP